MKLILISYILIINFIGFLLMGIDKRRARRHQWRIPERTLFLVALFLGNIGILTGMYLFRHKTRHLSFAIGIPAILIIQLFLGSLLYSWNERLIGSPSQAVQRELDRIEALDADTIRTFVSYENLMNSSLTSGETGDEAAEAVELFFKNFEYHIHNEQIDGNTATVSVTITNIDMEALARDVCTAIIAEAAVLYPDSSASSINNYYQLLRDTLASNSYELAVTTAYFHLLRDDSGWSILSDTELEDQLVSGFISYMNDSQLLSPDTVLSIYLDAFYELSPEQWKSYLDVDDIFATYNTDYSGLIDEEYISQLASAYDYKIIKTVQDQDTATVTVRIRSVDMTNVLTAYKQSLLSYAASSQSIRDNSIQFSNETSRLLLEALEGNSDTASTDVDLSMSNNGSVWTVHFNTDFTNALLGDMAGAIEAFNSIGIE